MTRGNWTDRACWYCTIQDAGKTGFVLGPFATEAACREWAYRDAADGGVPEKNSKLHAAGEKADWRSVFYGWGMAKVATGHREGVLNMMLPEADADMHRGAEVAA